MKLPLSPDYTLLLPLIPLRKINVYDGNPQSNRKIIPVLFTLFLMQ